MLEHSELRVISAKLSSLG